MAVRALRKPAPIWLLNAALSAAAVALYVFVRRYGPAEGPALPWWVLAPVVLATERWPVELHFGRSSHSFSLTDIPVTLALVFANGGDAMIALALGAAAAFGLRRLPPVKFTFNIAQYALITGASVLVARIGIGWTRASAGSAGSACWSPPRPAG